MISEEPRAQLDSSIQLHQPLSNKATEHRGADRRHEASTEFENLKSQIRQCDGLNSFALPLNPQQLMQQVGESNAVVSVKLEVTHLLSLNRKYGRFLFLLLTSAEVEKNAARFQNALGNVTSKTYFRSKQVMRNIEVTVGCRCKGHSRRTRVYWKSQRDAAWPRVWWVGSGLLNIFPIHAAGYRDPDSTRNVISRVVSSYIPNIRSMSSARGITERVSTQDVQEMVIVSMPATPRQRDLHYAKQEVEELRKLISPGVHISEAQSRTKAEVLALLKDAQVMHFACHGISDIDPSRSRLLLNDWKTDPLCVSDVTSLKLKHPKLAYLSACHTASSRDISLLDEVIHLSSAFQLAGFPSVVGSLWQVNDMYSVRVEKDVYSWMLDGHGKIETRKAAEGLHRSIRCLIDETRKVPLFSRIETDDPLIWAPFIHLGI